MGSWVDIIDLFTEYGALGAVLGLAALVYVIIKRVLKNVDLEGEIRFKTKPKDQARSVRSANPDTVEPRDC